jgi:integrase
MPESSKSQRPKKPYPNFPLFPHPNGLWCKKIRGKAYYFGVWADPDAALKKYLEQKDDLFAGRKPRPTLGDGLTLRDLCNRFLTLKKHLLDCREIKALTFYQWHRVCKLLIDHFGRTQLVETLGPGDFGVLRVKMAEKWGPVYLGNMVQYIRSVFQFAVDAELIDRPVRYGVEFDKPSRRVLRLHRAQQGERLFTAEELRRILNARDPQLKAAVLLGVNCGLGNTDVGSLEVRHLDLEGSWLNFPRPKTGVARRAWLWPETIQALRDVLATRPRPKDPADAARVFLTRLGTCFLRASVTDTGRDEEADIRGKVHIRRDDVLGKKFIRLLRQLSLYRRGFGLYTMRHIFETVASGSKDQVAVNAIMGHVDRTMAAVYRERIEDERLRAVAEHVHGWLFPTDSFAPQILPLQSPKATVG